MSTEASTGIVEHVEVTDRKRTLSDDNRDSSSLTLDNDDSGFSELPHPSHSGFDNVRLGNGDHKTQYSNFIQDGTPIPRSSSTPIRVESSQTPTRVEIFIEENWNKSQENIDTEPYDLALNDSANNLYWRGETKDENNNVCEGRSKVCEGRSKAYEGRSKELEQPQRLLQLAGTRLRTESFGENPIPEYNRVAFQDEFSYFVNNRNNEPLASCTLSNNTSFNEKDEKSNTGLIDAPTSEEHGEELLTTDYRPLVQIKTELYEDVSDADDVQNFDICKVKTEPVEEVQKSVPNDEWKAIDENVRQPLDTIVKNEPSEAEKVSSTSEDILKTVNSNNPVTLSRKRAGRKSKAPKRSPKRCDPKFKGATVWFQTEYSRGRSRLNISAFYSNVTTLFTDKTRQGLFGNHLISCSPDTSRYSDTEENSTPPYGRDTFITAKTCASCRTRRTPLWRDAEDGTPLCNACGIRYKKYRLRCSRCWHIPKKDIKTYPNCPLCGASLRYVFGRRAW